MEVNGIFKAPIHSVLSLETLGKVVLEQDECREVGHIPCDAASSEQWPRDVMMDHHHLKTPLLQNQPVIIIKTFPLQTLLVLICLSSAVSKMCL